MNLSKTAPLGLFAMFYRERSKFMLLGDFICLTGINVTDVFIKVTEIAIIYVDDNGITTLYLKDYESQVKVKQSPREIIHIINGSTIPTNIRI